MTLPPIRIVTHTPAPVPIATSPAEKPSSCRNCRLFTQTSGIVLDCIPPTAKAIFLFLSPSKDEINERRPLAGGMGFFVQNLARATGFGVGEYGVSYIFRCYAGEKLRDKNWKLNDATIKDGFHGCRVHDHSSMAPTEWVTLPTGVRDWAPDTYIATFEPSKGFLQPAFAIMTRKDMRKARELAEQGKRPCVIFGSPAMKLMMPWSEDGGMKMFRGSAEEFTWEPRVDRIEAVPEVFKQSQGWGRRRR
jgi:hypothetical protein